jgi:Tfp pilus assembly protein PilO
MALGWKKEYFRYKGFFLNISLLYKRREDVRMFLEIMLSLTTVAIFSIFALRPTILTISQLIRDNKTKEGVVATLTAKAQALTDAQNVYEQETANISAIKFAVPDQAGVEVLDRQIEMLAVQNSVKILNFMVEGVNLVGKPVVQPVTAGLSPYPVDSIPVSFSLTATGDYTALFAFQKGLENLRRPIKIDSVKIFTATTEAGNSLNLSLTGRVPYLITQ